MNYYDMLFAQGSARKYSYSKAEIDAMLADKADLDSDGLVPISEMPPSAIEHMKDVQDDTARFALTTDEVQNGDTVYVDSTQIMYLVIDETKLDQEAGYKAYSAGIATKAIADKNGNDITATYATLAYVAELVGDINSVLEEVL